MKEKYKEFKEFILKLNIGEESKNTVLCAIDFCEQKRFYEARKLIQSVCGENIPALYQLMYKILELYTIDGMLYEFCKALHFIIKHLISFKRYQVSSKLYDDLQNIAFNHNKYSDKILHYFAQTLELLFAYGYINLGIIIYYIYQHISEDNIYQLTELTLSKRLSCVYIIDQDNKRKVAKKCSDAKKQIYKSSRNDLQGLCYYYLGIVEEFDAYVLNRNKVIEDCIMCGSSGYMEKSKKFGFLLAKKYLNHQPHANFVTSQMISDCSSSLDYDG